MSVPTIYESIIDKKIAQLREEGYGVSTSGGDWVVTYKTSENVIMAFYGPLFGREFGTNGEQAVWCEFMERVPEVLRGFVE